jgi:hypothetical protein
VLTLWLFCNGSILAQEPVRTSTKLLKIQSFNNPESFFRIGPLQEELTVSTGFEYTDNAQLTNTNKISRARFFQGLDLNTTWVISHFNKLSFTFGGQLNEDFYGNGTNQVNVAIAPNSALELQFAISDFRVRLYDRFSYTQDPTTNPTATNTATLNNLTNVVGGVIDGDFNLAVLSLFGDYTYNDQSGQNAAGQTNSSTSGTRNSFRAGSSIGFHYSPTVLYGIEVTATRTTGSTSGGSGNINSLSVGPFLRGKMGVTDFDLSAGVEFVDAKPSIPTTPYFSGAIRHQFNRNLQAILSASHDLVFTTGTDLTEETIFRLGAQFNLTRFIALIGGPFINFGNEKTGPNEGRFTQYGLAAALNWKPHRRWSADLSYNLYRREGISAPDSYLQNTIAIRVSYKF